MASDMGGTIIHGTLRNEDVIPALYNYLSAMDSIDPEYPKVLDDLTTEVDRIADWDSDETSEIALGLFDAIDQFLPEGFYCGALPGDGSDFGIWRHEEDE